MKYVVTGPARSGTKYVATLLSEAGMKCGHEGVFNSWGSNFTRAPRWQDETDYLGDSSFIVAPFIPEVKGKLKVVHLVRPPLDVIRSIVGIGHVGDNRAPWVQFLNAHINLTQFPPGPQRAAAYWVRWNRLIRHHEPDLTWDVTRITSDEILELAMLTEIDVDPAAAGRAVQSTDRAINHRERADWVNLDHLGRVRDEVVALADQLGVPLESSESEGHEPAGYVADEINEWKGEEVETPLDHNVVKTEGGVLLSHLGAGWYELINVETNEVIDKIRGKEAAEARMSELEMVELSEEDPPKEAQ